MGLNFLLTKHLQRTNCTGHLAPCEFDLMILITVTDEVEKELSTTIVGKETDLLILLTVIHPPR